MATRVLITSSYRQEQIEMDVEDKDENSIYQLCQDPDFVSLTLETMSMGTRNFQAVE